MRVRITAQTLNPPQERVLRTDHHQSLVITKPGQALDNRLWDRVWQRVEHDNELHKGGRKNSDDWIHDPSKSLHIATGNQAVQALFQAGDEDVGEATAALKDVGPPQPRDVLVHEEIHMEVRQRASPR